MVEKVPKHLVWKSNRDWNTSGYVISGFDPVQEVFLSFTFTVWPSVTRA